jgi:hypothetical protein
VRSFVLALVAALMASMPFVQAASAAVPPPASIVRAVEDPADAIPTPEEVKAALTLFGIPAMTAHDLPDNDPLWDLFDEAGRFVIPPSPEIGEVTFIVGAYNVEDGDDEQQDFAETYQLLQDYAAKRVGPTGQVKNDPPKPEDLFGANEAMDVTMITMDGMDGATAKNVMYSRLARFGKTIIFVSGDVKPVGPNITENELFASAITFFTIAKLVSDKVK